MTEQHPHAAYLQAVEDAAKTIDWYAEQCAKRGGVTGSERARVAAVLFDMLRDVAETVRKLEPGLPPVRAEDFPKV